MPYSSPIKVVQYSVCLVCILAGCGGGSSDSPPAPSSPLPPKIFSTTLNWAAPANRMDGSAMSLNEIAGYKIYMGESNTELSLFKKIDDPQTFSFEITDLTEGSYYFAVAAYDDKNLTSPKSTVIRREFK